MRTFQKKIVVVLVLAGLLCAAFWAGYPSLLGLLADHYYAQANLADDADVPDLVDRLASLGAPAIPCLTVALGSERKVVAQAVRARLIESVESWEHPDTRPTPKARLTLAGSLANRMEQYGPSARLHAVGLAQRMLRVSSDGLTRKEAEWLTLACESILNSSRSAARDDALTAKGETTGALGNFDAPTSRPRNSGNTVPLSERSLLDMARLPGGDLPTAMPELGGRQLTPEEGGGYAAASLAPPKRTHADRSLLSNDAPSDRFSPEGAKRQGKSSRDSDLAAGQSSDLRRLPKNPALRPIESSESVVAAATAPRYASRAPSEKPSERVYSLILQLHSGDQRQSDKARRELNDGGFKTVHFALAERLTDPDPEVRKELIRVLPRLKSVQTGSWLKWLLKDDDPSVRHAALVTLASSSDPTLLAEAAQTAQSDDDPKIRLEGERIERRLAQ